MTNYVATSKNTYAKATALTASGRHFIRQAIAVIFLVIAAISFFSGQAATAGSENLQVHFTYVTVRSGESLWQLADRIAPYDDPREWIVKVVNLNALTSTEVTLGQRIALP